jgi:hypothetical protein
MCHVAPAKSRSRAGAKNRQAASSGPARLLPRLRTPGGSLGHFGIVMLKSDAPFRPAPASISYSGVLPRRSPRQGSSRQLGVTNLSQSCPLASVSRPTVARVLRASRLYGSTLFAPHAAKLRFKLMPRSECHEFPPAARPFYRWPVRNRCPF